MPSSVGRKAWWVAFGLAALPLVGFWVYGLFDLDEGFYAAIVAEMNRRHEWVTPYFNGRPWFEKPILLYWFAKPTVLLFFNEFGARLPSVLASLGVYLLCGRFLARRGAAGAGVLVMPILGSCALVAGAGRMMLTDPLLSLAVAGAFLAFYESLKGDVRFKWLAGALLGVTVLGKGPVALPIFVALAVWTYFAEPELRPHFKGGWLVGSVLFVAVVASWYGPCWIANGDTFVQKFLIEQNVQRFASGDTAHSTPIYLAPIYYPVFLFVLMLPWSVPAIKGIPRRGTGGELERYLWRWALAWIVFFSISGSKLPHYVLPAIPPLAMLAALHLAAKGCTWRSPSVLVTPAVLCLLLNTGFSLYYFELSDHAEFREIAQKVRQTPGEVAAYQLPRREKELGTGKPKLMETSHPSLGFYLDRDFFEAETLDQLIDAPKPLWVITRPGRISKEDSERFVQQGFALDVSTGKFGELWRISNQSK